MIHFLRGTLAQSLPDRVVIDVNGVGYECLVPTSTFDALGPEGTSIKLLTHFHVREQEHSLFGFANDEERDLFRLLIDRVSGIGPKMALSILSGMPVSDFKSCVINGDITALSRIKGVGKKTAERMVVELKDKVGVAAAWQEAKAAASLPPLQAMANDVVLALINLGYKQVDATKVVKTLLDKDPKAGQADLLRAALRLLSV